jgi:hypothetical protein
LCLQVQSDIDYTINQLKSKARIILMCFDDPEQQRSFAIQLQRAGMDSNKYVYLLPDVDMQNGKCLERFELKSQLSIL